jgi:hypothetical protein
MKTTQNNQQPKKTSEQKSNENQWATKDKIDDNQRKHKKPIQRHMKSKEKHMKTKEKLMKTNENREE